MVGKTILHYRIVKELGKGGMGVVYKAEDLKLHRTVAIKILLNDLLGDERARKRFLREARAASAIDHPNICTVYEINETPDMLFFVMQYIEGETLKKKIGGHSLPLEVALDIALQLADALAEAHSRNVIHRDIKSSNIVMTERGQPKILDFGLAKLVEPTDGSRRSGHDGGGYTELTQQGVPFGTASYMSPEQARGEPADKRSDVYSLGVVIYEMVAGRLPFKGRTSIDVMHSVMHDAPAPLPPGVPPSVERLLERVLAKDPRQRFQSAAELLEELRRVARVIYTERGVLPMERAASLQAMRPRAEPRPTPFGRAMRWVKRNLLGEPESTGATDDEPSRELTVESGEASPSIFGGPSASARDKRTIAILPFRNLSGTADSDFYGFSLADAVITELAQLKSLVVRPSTYIAKYQNTEVDPRVVGHELAVDAVLVGGFLKAGDRFRVTPQLVDINTGEILWSDKIDVDSKDIITLQDMIAQRIADRLSLRLSEAEQDRLARAATQSPEAYELYLKGRSLLFRFSTQTLERQDLDDAVETFRRAIELDPNYAHAHSALGVCLTTYVMKGMGGVAQYDEAEAELTRALELDPNLIEPRTYLVYVYMSGGDKQRAREQIERVRREAPNNTDIHQVAGTLYRLDGRYEEALREFDRLLKIDPNEAVVAAYNRARIYTYRGEYEKAEAEIQRGMEVEPDHPLQKAFLGRIRFYQGRLDEAALLLEDVFEKAPSARGLLPILAIIYGARGEHDRARRLVQDDVIDTACADHDVAYWLASFYALENEREEALKWLERAVELGNENFPWFARDPIWDHMRDDPAYVNLIHRLKERKAAVPIDG
jgi:serine/threonine-protein kinase